jgi:proliferating cell nuclear antigen
MMEMHMMVGNVFKMIIEAIKELVAMGNLKCSRDEMCIQCMDSSHVALVNLILTQDNFTHYRCDHPCDIGFSLVNLTKVLKLMGHDDDITLCHMDQADTLNLIFRDPYCDGVLEFGMYLYHRLLCLWWRLILHICYYVIHPLHIYLSIWPFLSPVHLVLPECRIQVDGH